MRKKDLISISKIWDNIHSGMSAIPFVFSLKHWMGNRNSHPVHSNVSMKNGVGSFEFPTFFTPCNTQYFTCWLCNVCWISALIIILVYMCIVSSLDYIFVLLTHTHTHRRKKWKWSKIGTHRLTALGALNKTITLIIKLGMLNNIYVRLYIDITVYSAHVVHPKTNKNQLISRISISPCY